MDQLFLKICELLAQIPELKWIDWNTEQLHEENPPIAYPAALIDIDITNSDDVGGGIEMLTAEIRITYVFKNMYESNNAAPVSVRNMALNCFKTLQKAYLIFKKYKGNDFKYFTRKSVKNATIRKGLKTIVQGYTTSFLDTSASNP